jgi:hypothetical protein
MFMIVSYPWPVASAHVELSGRQPGGAAMHHLGVTEDSICHCARHVEDLVCWTGQERLRCVWYQLRLAVSDTYRRCRRITEPELRQP